MATIFLHIGLHKTGSTAIQSAFNGLKTRSTCYAELGFENHSIPIYTAFSGKHHEYGIWKRRGLTYAEIEKKRQEFLLRLCTVLRNEKHKNIIISGEDIGMIPASKLSSLYKTLTTNTSDVKVLAYVRDPMSFITSALQEEIKNGYLGKVSALPNYRAKLEKFRSEFGNSNTIIREYARHKLPNGDVVEDFASFVGVQASRKALRENKSLSTEAVRVIHQINQLVHVNNDAPEMIYARMACINHLASILPGRFTLPEHLIAGLVEPADVSWLYETSGIDFRMSIPEFRPSFNRQALVCYLEDIKPTTLDAIRLYLQHRNGTAVLPSDTKFLLARYLFSFVPPTHVTRLQRFLSSVKHSRLLSTLKT